MSPHTANPVESARYEKRIDDLLDEVSRLGGLLAACNDLDGIEVLAVSEALRVAVAENADCMGKLLTFGRFAEACKKTGYRPFAWELEIILDPPRPGPGITRT